MLALAAGALTGQAHAADDVDDLLDDAGPGFQQGQDAPGPLGATTRTFVHPNGQLQLQMIPLSDGIDVRQMFALVAQVDVPDVVEIDEPGPPLSRWFALEGVDPEVAPVVFVAFASRSSIFTALLTSDDVTALPPLATLRGLVPRQVERAGGPPPDAAPAPDPIDPGLTAFLPAEPATRFGLTSSATVGGKDELPPELGIDPEVTTFLNSRSRTAVRVWTNPDTELSAAVSVTDYPYGVFAAAVLGATTDGHDLAARPFAGVEGVPDVVTFVGQGPKEGQVGTSLRRGRLSVLILVQAGQGGLEEAAAVAVDLTRQVDGLLPAGATTPYHFPTPPSTIAGLALTAAVVTAAGAAFVGVGRARAWTLRRSSQSPRSPNGAGDEPAPVEAGPAPTAGSQVVSLDEDARELRRRGAVVVVVQLIALNVIVVSLAGDFGWTGVVVAVLGLAGGLGFTSWWRRRELGAIGPQGSGAPFILPRPAGALVGIIALAVLGIGVSYAFKGLRYLLLKPTLAQLRWSDLLGLSPRGVGVLFALGGLVVAAIGGFLFRVARALGRADTRRLLAVDHRPPLLYLRSFADDTLPLATIASARRPFFELLSFRGRDPFEEAVAWELATYGPVVAVGRPGHSLASLGAAREHLSDDTWKAQVARRMDDARAIAVATGETPGLHWEVAQIVAAGHLDKTVFVFPPVDRDTVTRRWEFTAASLVAAGARASALPADPGLVHTAHVAADGTVAVTVASHRDEASYRTAVDRAMARIEGPPVAADDAGPHWPPPDAAPSQSWSSSSSASSSASAAPMANPSARVMFPAAEAIRAVPTTGAIPMSTPSTCSSVIPTSVAAARLSR